MKVAERLNTINEYYFSTKIKEVEALRKSGKDIISLAIGSPDLAPAPIVINKLHEVANNPKAHGYQSYQGTELLRRAFSDFYDKHYGVAIDPTSEVLPLIGSKEGIFHVCMTFLNPGDQVLLPSLGYPTYRAAVVLSGGVPVYYPMTEGNNYFPVLEELEKLDLSKVKLMWINYPNMPTGQLPTHEIFEKIIAFGKRNNILICHDNPYSFICNDNPMSILSIPGAKDVVIELNSLSKSHNMAGWRVGAIFSNKEIISDVLRFKSNIDTGMFLGLQAAAATALELGKEWFTDLNVIYKARRKAAQEFLDVIKCSYNMEHSGMFVWAKIPDALEDSYKLADNILYNFGIFITPGGIFGDDGKRYIRVSLCAPVEVYKSAIERVVKSVW